MPGRLPQMKGIGPPSSVMFAAIRPVPVRAIAPMSYALADTLTIWISAGSADHGAAAAGFGFANLGVARFQHFSLGKLRFSFAE